MGIQHKRTQAKIDELKARLALYSLLEDPGVECGRGRYWDSQKKAYADGWLIGDVNRLTVISSGPTLEDALRAAQQKRKGSV